MRLLSILLFFLFIHLKANSADTMNIFENLNHTESQISFVKLETKNVNSNIDLNLENLNKLITIFNEFKSYDSAYAQSLVNKVKNHDTLSGTEIYMLRRLMTVYYKINQLFLDFAITYDLGGFKMSSTFAEVDHNIPQMKAHIIWLAGHLLVLDHLETMHAILYESDDNFRRIVKSALIDNGEDEIQSKTLNDIIKLNKYTVEIGEEKKFREQIIFVRNIYAEINIFFIADLEVVKLLQEIYNNQTSQLIAQGKVKFHAGMFTFTDAVHNTFNKTVGWFSKLFGNWAGSVKSRKGHLYNNNEVLNKASTSLRPLDIMLDKSSFILTDKFIPGYFDHVAIYLGTREQLEEIGMWNHPDIIPYQNDIESGNIILEAVRDGVHLNKLASFLNIDELVVIRRNNENKDPSILFDQIARGIGQIGKAYDFNFDISTLDTIVCSELIYIVFGDVHWPTEYRLGRPTITPDNIAEILFQKNSKFSLQTLILPDNDQRKIQTPIEVVASELSYEMRNKNGLPVQNLNDPENSYWKKITKCHSVVTNNHRDGSVQSIKKVCEVSYAEYSYQEL